jgi:two-component system, OmpR family, response regulator
VLAGEKGKATVNDSVRSPIVLLVEDDEPLVAAVGEYLSKAGLEIHAVHQGDHALDAVLKLAPDLIVLDIMLPGIDGIEVCRRLRRERHEMPVLMLTAKDEDFDRVLALEIGADDYLVKPVQPRVLLAHIKAMLRRSSLDVSRDSSALVFGRLSINRNTRDVTLSGASLNLSSAEFDLMWLLASRAGRVVHRDHLLLELRGLEEAHDDRSIDARLYRLRKRFPPEAQAQRRIKSIRPHGYLFSVEPW